MIEIYIAQLHDADAAQRFEAANRLGEYGDMTLYTPAARLRAIDALIPALIDPDSKAQYAVFSALVKLSAREAFPAMLDMLLSQPDSRVWGLLKLTIGMRLRNALLDMMPTGQPDMTDRLSEALENTQLDSYQRGLLLRLLGKSRDARFVEPMIDQLLQGDEVMRGAAAEALGYMGDARAVSPLMLYLAPEEDERIREMAITALGRLGDVRVADPLLGLLGDESEWVRAAAVGALADLGERRAVEPLSHMLRDESAMVADAAFEALKRFSYEKLDMGVTNGANRRFISLD
jgi:HEAT repeat protein